MALTSECLIRDNNLLFTNKNKYIDVSSSYPSMDLMQNNTINNNNQNSNMTGMVNYSKNQKHSLNQYPVNANDNNGNFESKQLQESAVIAQENVAISNDLTFSDITDLSQKSSFPDFNEPIQFQNDMNFLSKSSSISPYEDQYDGEMPEGMVKKEFPGKPEYMMMFENYFPLVNNNNSNINYVNGLKNNNPNLDIQANMKNGTLVPHNVNIPNQINTPKSTSSTPKSSMEPNLKRICKPKREKKANNIIEKRYRSNINDKMTYLKKLVPSLRVASKREEGIPIMVEDSMDLDGLQPARKLNKASILLKTIEYIKHLENKCYDIKIENQSLKTCLSQKK
ncbi:hypothetical protein Kpol_526p29 [Vanderwaltozyma polyspora DSM 70294]|uniref:BHLH domain-containing protein n=1 Tax=Vanderwaltozyma polyspora (strain ATCC 22028 / DSM 70294 / BCRC 21397 / CBS 2163 / NBRC 10782 / NRRL Y-8283 / UCD 57-17) TaxID=436907 RepID=A7TLT4_VANPO|nr:uncharacterized protein Kpol_526p29 [Vanderwaltozyma polyspora DSM 70294]EDO16776.1 hypothetical protein Kpol_526p29 [Vanderwaltozyma polyspora DSM 70294]